MYKLEKEKIEKALVVRRVAKKARTRSLVDLEVRVNDPETKKSLLIKTKKKFLSC